MSHDLLVQMAYHISVTNHDKLSQISISFADNQSVVGYYTIDQRILGMCNLPVVRIFIQL